VKCKNEDPGTVRARGTNVCVCVMRWVSVLCDDLFVAYRVAEDKRAENRDTV